LNFLLSKSRFYTSSNTKMLVYKRKNAALRRLAARQSISGKPVKPIFFLPIPHPSPSLFLPSSSIPHSSILSLSRLRSVFLLVSFPLSHFAASVPHVRDRLSLSSRHILHILSSSSIQYLFSLSSFPHLNLTIIFFFRALFPQVHRNILCHAPLILPVVPLFSDSLPSLLLVRISVLLAQLRTHPSSFRSHSFHFLDGIPVPPAVLLSLLLIRVLFLFSIALNQYPALFPSAHSVLEFCRSLSRFHSQLAPLVSPFLHSISSGYFHVPHFCIFPFSFFFSGDEGTSKINYLLTQ
jgi:hypothetical protein